MGNEIVVLPLDYGAFHYFQRHRIKLNIPHRDSRDRRRNDFGDSASIPVRMPRLNEEGATDDERESTDPEPPKPQRAATRTRIASFGLNCGLMLRD